MYGRTDISTHIVQVNRTHWRRRTDPGEQLKIQIDTLLYVLNDLTGGRLAA